MATKPIQSADLSFDDQGRLKVDASGVTITADNIALDQYAVTGGAGGDPGTGGKTLADIVTALLTTGIKTATNALPSGAATNAGIAGASPRTLADLADLLGALSTPAAGTVNAQLAAAVAHLAEMRAAGLRTYEVVAITQASAGWTKIRSLVAAKSVALHKLYLKADAAGTLTIQSADDDAGTNAAALTGVYPIAAYDTFKDEQVNAALCLATPVGKSLGFTTATAKVFGYAVISYLT
jgi:hypothetical protein